jgi:hypothetical protein
MRTSPITNKLEWIDFCPIQTVAVTFLLAVGLAPTLADVTPVDTFDPSPDGWVRALALQRDGKILVGGHFMKLCGQIRTGMGRLHADGRLDEAFDAGVQGASAAVYALLL